MNDGIKSARTLEVVECIVLGTITVHEAFPADVKEGTILAADSHRLLRSFPASSSSSIIIVKEGGRNKLLFRRLK